MTAVPPDHRGVGEGGPTTSGVVLYWRPGCGFCFALRRRLRRMGLLFEEVNIWEDPSAAALVRSVARGNETVPTVVVGRRALVNPSAADVLEAIRGEMPELFCEPASARPRGWRGYFRR